MNLSLASMPSSANRKFLLKDIAHVIDFAAQKRKFGKDACYIFIRGVTERSKVNVAEIMKVMESALKSVEHAILEHTDKNEVLVVVHAPEDFCKNTITTMYGFVSPHAVTATAYPLNDRGLEQLAKLFDTLTPANDFVGRLNATRFSRKTNVFLVLDDDPMILKQLDFILKAHGQVTSSQMAEEFLHNYKKMAPNCVMIDIHLRTEKGTALANVLRAMLDPFAHVIIMSSDTVKENIIETKNVGGSSFIGKPINRDLVTRAVLACPTVAVKK